MEIEGSNSELLLMLGSNMGHREALLQQAVDEIHRRIGEIKALSSVYETAPWGVNDQPAFLNVLVILDTSLPSFEVIKTVLAIEEKMGRDRSSAVKFGQRLIDIDILFYGSEVIRTELLTVPHPAIPERRFVLVPLNEVKPGLVHPVLGITARELLKRCPDKLEVKKQKIMLKKPKKVN